MFPIQSKPVWISHTKQFPEDSDSTALELVIQYLRVQFVLVELAHLLYPGM